MTKRFQIEDLIVQDETGVAFRALDSVTRIMVALRRFFPYGADGGGLQGEEQTAYNIALERLSGIRHPALRAVVAGGCDPIDDMPYVATEWVDGELLEVILAHGPLSAEDAAYLITQALEVCELLSHVLAEEAIWVETDAHTIVIGSPESGRGVTFWISPLKWLNTEDPSRGFGAIANLAENLMGWRGSVVSDHAGRGLGGWIKWLRTAPSSTPLHEIREMLAASVGAEPPPTAKNLTAKAIVKPTPTIANSPSDRTRAPSAKVAWFSVIGMLFVIIGVAGWWWLHHGSNPDLTNTSQESNNTNGTPPNNPNDTIGIIAWNSRDQLIQHRNQEVTIEGKVKGCLSSSSGKTFYLVFDDPSEKKQARVGIDLNNDDPENLTSQFKAMIGRQIQARGLVVVRPNFGKPRPEIMVDSISSIRIVK